MKICFQLMGVLTAAMLMSFSAPPQNKVKWQEWDSAYEQAKKTNKILLIDAYTDWCGWCKRMDRDTYSSEEIAQLIDKDFIPVKFNPEITNKKYNVDGSLLTGPELLYALTNGQRIGYPTTFFLFTQKKQVKLKQGYLDAVKFKQALNEMREFK